MKSVLLVFFLVLLISQTLAVRVLHFNSTICEGVFHAAEIHPNNICLRRPDGMFVKYICAGAQSQICESDAQCSTCTNAQNFNNNQCYNGRRFSCEDVMPNNYGSSVFNITRGPCGAPSTLHFEIRTPVCRPTEDRSGFEIVTCIGNRKIVRTCTDRDCKQNCVENSRPIAPCTQINGYNATEFCIQPPPPQQLPPCRLSDIDAAARTLSQLLNSTSLGDASGEVIRQTFERLLGDKLSACIELMNRFVTGYTENNAQVMTTECGIDKQDPSWMRDPCCNPALQQDTCCAPRTITRVTRFPILAPVNCTNTERVRAIYYNYYNLLFNQKPAPESEEARASRTIPECTNHVLRGNIPCQSNADCIFTGSCRPNGVCKAVSTPSEFYMGFAKCIMEEASAPAGGAVPPLGRVLVATRLQAAQTVAAIAQAMGQTFAKPSGSCIRINNNGNMDPTMIQSQAACIAQNVRCNDPEFVSQDGCNVPPTNQSFCGDCSMENFCFRHPANSPALCSNVVTCKKGEQDGPTFLTVRQNCDPAKFSCTIRPDLHNTQQACLNARECSIAPGKSAICLLRSVRNPVTCGTYNVNELTLNCVMTIAGYCTCTHKPANITQSNLNAFCGAQQGQMIQLDTQNACENLDRRCQINRPAGGPQLNFFNGTECGKCGGALVPQFAWRAGQWVNDVIVRNATWMPVAPLRAYQWITPGFDAQLFKTWIGETIASVYSRYIAAQSKRVYFAQLEFIRKFACDCGAEKKQNCFAEPVKYGVAVVNAVPGTAQNFNFPEANVTVKANSFNANRGASVAVDVEQANIDVDAALPTTRKIKQSANANVVVINKSNGASIGHVIGSGISLSTAPDNAVTLCLPIDTRVTTTYTKPVFAILENGMYHASILTGVTETGGYLCADVATTMTYYPAKIDATVTPTNSPVKPVASTPVKPKPNTGAIASISAMLILVVLALFML